MGNKRRRLALSCVDCRRRKVKCDRTFPSCVRCQKGGYGDKCTYVTHTSGQSSLGLPTPEEDNVSRRDRREVSWVDEAEQWEESSRNVGTRPAPTEHSQTTIQAPFQAPLPRLPPSSTDRRIVQLHGRLAELETYVYAAGGKPISGESNVGISNPVVPFHEKRRNPWAEKYVPSESEKALMRGQSFKTSYFGPSNSLSILLQFEELSRFVKEILLAIPSLTVAKRQLAKIREKTKVDAKATFDLSLDNLISMIPERNLTDRLLHQYLNTFETTYRVLHIPQFLKRYEEFWKSPRDALPDFIIQLLLVMAAVYCVTPGGAQGYLGRSSVRRETATHWVNVCQNWLEAHSHKHVDLAYYQTHILCWIARRTNCIKIKREWVSTGHIVRMFTAAGFHREPSILSAKINSFDCEMRRRLWYTAIELDLLTAIDRGMTPTISPQDWDTLPPSNIDDEAFNVDSDKLPDPKPRTEFTRTAFLAHQSEHLPLRIEMLRKINSIGTTLDEDVAMFYDEKLRALLDDLPTKTWKEPSNTNSSTMSPSINAGAELTPIPVQRMTIPAPDFAIALSKLVLYEFILILHQPYATQNPLSHRHFFSRAARRDACLCTMQIYNPDLSQQQRYLMANIRDDIVRAALSAAHDLAMSPSWSIVHEQARVLDSLHNSVSILGDRVKTLGQGFHCYWITSSALSFVHSKQSPLVPRATFAQAAADRVVRLHDSVMQNQLPQARELMNHDEEIHSFRQTDIVNNVDLSRVAKNGSHEVQTAGERVEQITTVDGLRSLLNVSNGTPAAQHQHSTPIPGAATMDGPGTAGTEFVSFDQVDPFGDSMFGIENLDWSNIWNVDPLSMVGLDMDNAGSGVPTGNAGVNM